MSVFSGIQLGINKPNQVSVVNRAASLHKGAERVFADSLKISGHLNIV